MFVFSLAEMNTQSLPIFDIQVFFRSSSDTFSRVAGVRSSGSLGVYVKASTLLNTRIIGLRAAPHTSARVLLTTSICSSKWGWLTSTTCTSTSASRTSSSVDLNESTRCVGSLRMKPTVSVNRKGRLSITTLRTVVSRVAKSLFSAKTSLLLRRFMSVDLPALV